MNWKQNEIDDSKWIVLADSGLNIFSRYGEELFCFSFIRFPEWAELWTKQYTLKQCLNTKSDYTVTWKYDLRQQL